MKASELLLIVGIAYIAPHIGPRLGLAFGVLATIASLLFNFGGN